MNATIRSLLCAAGVLVACTLPCRASPLYHLTPLGYLSGKNESYATAINADGQVVGYDSSTLNTDPFPYIWSASSGLRPIATPSAGNNPTGAGGANGINASGEVAGNSDSYHGFVWTSAAGATDIGALPGYSAYTFAIGINDSGQVAGGGYASTPQGPREAFLWSAGGGMQGLGTLGGTQSFGRAINNNGQIVGDSTNASGFDHAFLWTSGGGMMDLGTLSGETASAAYAISTNGIVVGDATNSLYSSNQVFMWTSGGGMQSVFTFNSLYVSQVYGVNDSGEIVGEDGGVETGPYVGSQAFLWNQSIGFQHLNSLVDSSGAGWDLKYATGINDAGEIVGWGTNSSGFYQEGFLLTPIVPEPSASILAVVGAAGLGCWRFRRRRPDQPPPGSA